MTKAGKPTDAASESVSYALRDLIEMRSSVHHQIKARAFADLRKLSRTFVGLLLLSDDLGEAADIEEVIQRLRNERTQSTAEVEALTRRVAELEAAEATHSARVSELAGQAEQLKGRIAQSERRKANLANDVIRYEAMSAEVDELSKRLDGLRAEEGRLKPLVDEYRCIERDCQPRFDFRQEAPF
jgi:chromosome segregation ATPase